MTMIILTITNIMIMIATCRQHQGSPSPYPPPRQALTQELFPPFFEHLVIYDSEFLTISITMIINIIIFHVQLYNPWNNWLSLQLTNNNIFDHFINWDQILIPGHKFSPVSYPDNKTQWNSDHNLFQSTLFVCFLFSPYFLTWIWLGWVSHIFCRA